MAASGAGYFVWEARNIQNPNVLVNAPIALDLSDQLGDNMLKRGTLLVPFSHHETNTWITPQYREFIEMDRNPWLRRSVAGRFALFALPRSPPAKELCGLQFVHREWSRFV